MDSSATTTKANLSQEKQHEEGTRLHGNWLTLARVIWIALVLFLLSVFIGSLPANFAVLHQPCSGAWCAYGDGQLTASEIKDLPHHGLSLDAYTWSWIVINVGEALVCFAVGGILFWRKSDDWMALLVALMVISIGVTSATNDLLFSSSFLRIPENGVLLIESLAILFTLALFPNGRFVPRWAGLVAMIYPAYIVLYLVFLRPLRIPGWALFYTPFNGLAWFGCWIVLTLAQLYRYIRVSNALERQQTKWVAFSFFILVLGLVGHIIIPSLPSIQHNHYFYDILDTYGFSLLKLLIPISLGIAMFRYRLWDIDVIINRTLVYGVLTALLALLYFGLIFALQSLFQGIFHQNNAFAIVVSTIVIYALFQPLRRRIQAIIDRRFYRRKYDAAKTLEAFSATLRNEVDLSKLREELVAVVQETMQPSHVSLWLRQPERHTVEPLRLEKTNKVEEGF